MRPRHRERGQLLILLGAWLFFGGGASSALVAYQHPVSEMRKGVEHSITDSARREAIESDIGQWDYVQKIHAGNVSESREQLLKLMRRKDTQRAQLEPLLAKLDKRFLVMDWDFLNLRFRVKEKVSSAEWSAIVPRPER
ncbi:MAG TPA: hypothetical protein VGI91_07780 [Steroidobacteraceae bacterium]